MDPTLEGGRNELAAVRIAASTREDRFQELLAGFGLLEALIEFNYFRLRERSPFLPGVAIPAKEFGNLLNCEPHLLEERDYRQSAKN